MESTLKIINWREQTFNVEKSNPKLCSYFTTMWNTVALHEDDTELNWLKYLDNEAEFNIEAMEAKFTGNNTVTFVRKAEEKVSLLKNLVESSDYLRYVNEANIVTYSNVLSILMNTPFEIDDNKKNWQLQATVDDENRIYLVEDPTRNTAVFNRSSPFQTSTSLPDYFRLLENHCEKLKQYLFVRWPIDHYRNVTSTLDRHFYETYRLNLSKHKILYAAELCGINSYVKVSNLNELKTAEHIMCDAFFAGELPRETVNYNPLWWSKAYLINANQCILGVIDKNNNKMNKIIQFNTDRFTDVTKFENLWSPKASWKFLDTFLTFVKDEIERVTSDRKKFIWKFKIIYNESPQIICEPIFVDGNSGNELRAKIEHFT